MLTIALGIVLGFVLLALLPYIIAYAILILISKTFWKIVGFSICIFIIMAIIGAM